MENSIIAYKSITVANRAKKLMKRSGIEVSIIQIPASFGIKGCNYAVRLKRGDLKRALEISEEYGLKIRKYFENADV